MSYPVCNYITDPIFDNEIELLFFIVGMRLENGDEQAAKEHMDFRMHETNNSGCDFKTVQQFVDFFRGEPKLDMNDVYDQVHASEEYTTFEVAEEWLLYVLETAYNFEEDRKKGKWVYKAVEKIL
jgi:hypothetical protein